MSKREQKELTNLIWNEATKRSISFSELAEILRITEPWRIKKEWGDHAEYVAEVCEMIAAEEEA